jgi:hypothetical protein
VIETFQAFLSPLEPHSQLAPPGTLSINYDAILPSSRRSVARSVTSCRKAMSSVRQDLEAWGGRSRSQSDNDPGTGVAGEQRRIGLAGEMSRKVQLGAITPTKQSMESSVGREVSSLVVCKECSSTVLMALGTAVVLRFTCDPPLFDVAYSGGS